MQGSNVFIGEDICARVKDLWRKLIPHMKAKRNEGCRVSMVFDHLLVVGKRFTVEDYESSWRLNRKLASLAIESNLGRFMARLVRAMLWEHIVG